MPFCYYAAPIFHYLLRRMMRHAIAAAAFMLPLSRYRR